MNKSIILGFAFMALLATNAKAEYCEDQFYKDVANTNAEVASLMLNNKTAQDESLKRLAAISLFEKSYSNLLDDITIPDSSKIPQLKLLHTEKMEQQKIVDKLTLESSKRTQRIIAINQNAPKDLQQKAQECAAKLAPLNLVVNYSIMALGAYFAPQLTGGLLANNPKALYVDMGEVINGNVMGGPKSAPNVLKGWVNDVIGGLGVKL